MANKGRPREGAPTRYTDASNVTPSDVADLGDGPCVALLIGAAGTLTVDTVDGTSNITLAVEAGVVALAVSRVYATGTTATDISALY